MSTSAQWESPRLEVRVYRHGDLVDVVPCDTEAEAYELVQQWADMEDVRCDVLEIGSGPPSVESPEPDELDELDVDADAAEEETP